MTAAAKSTKTFPNGDVYVGQLKHGRLSGHGQYTSSNGDCYTGQFKNDLRDGQGRYEYSNGAQYTGQFKKGQRHGHGRYESANGQVYEGHFQNGRFLGQKDQTGPGGSFWSKAFGCVFSQIDGQFEDNSLSKEEEEEEERQLTLEIKRGGYIEEEVTGRRFSNGDVYTGTLRNGRIDGQGRLEKPNGDVITGQFRDGHFEGQVHIKLAKYKDEFRGTIRDCHKEGHGRQVYSCGSVYEGTFKNSLRHGHGRMEYANGDIYDGDWFKDNKHGEGSYTLYKSYGVKSGVTFSGRYEKDEPLGIHTRDTYWPGGNRSNKAKVYTSGMGSWTWYAI